LSTAAARPRVLTTIAEAREAMASERAAGHRVSLTPTLGALHVGHLAHLERAAELVDVRVVSIFVNPLQFGPSEDLAKYPRTLDDDLDRLGELGVPYVFAPTADDMYPDGRPETLVSAGKIGELYEGRSRPGHFDGVLTVVAKLVLIIGPDVVTFGQKDAQQLFLVRRMIRDLNIPVKLEAIDIVREDDGLALSSRNRYLDSKERRAARTLSLALEAAASSADRGIDAVVAAAQGTLMGEPLIDLDYLKIVSPDTFLPVDDGYRGPALVLVAAKVGTTRLIDNERISLAG
jgi:pantoate--beta-alanine ligase